MRAFTYTYPPFSGPVHSRQADSWALYSKVNYWTSNLLRKIIGDVGT